MRTIRPWTSVVGLLRLCLDSGVAVVRLLSAHPHSVTGLVRGTLEGTRVWTAARARS